jgi:uncharacterized membrane protein
VDDIWTLVRFGHVLGVALWLGGMIVLAAVVLPAARGGGDPAAARAMITRAARRFGIVGGVAWLLILVTGFGLLEHRGLSVADLTASEYGRRILAKLVLLLVLGVIVLAHALWQGPRVRRAEAAQDAGALRRWRIVGGVFDAVLLLGSLAALWLAVSLIP